MIIPEYGRNIQEMILFTCTVEDREKRNKAAKFIVNIMAQMHPQVKDTIDYKRKLWDHMYIISNFQLDVDSPFPPPPPLTLSEKPEKISYHDKEIEFKHYGKNIAMIIEKATEFPEGPEKDALVKAIAIHLKKSYLNWNRESVTDELIEEHLKILSKGRKLIVPPQLEPVAIRLTKTELRPGSADNDVNSILSTAGGLPEGYIVNDFLTSAYSWFLLTNIDGLAYMERIKFESDMQVDFVTDNLLVKGYERYSFGYYNWRSIFGSFPTS